MNAYVTTYVHKIAPYRPHIDGYTCRREQSFVQFRKSVSRPKKHTLTQQLSVLILYHVHEIRNDVLNINNSQK